MEVFIYLLKSAGILSLFFLVYYIVLRQNTLFTANRHFLIAGILVAAIFPSLEFTRVVYIDPPVLPAVNFTDVSIPASEMITSTPSSGVDFWSIVISLYVVGMAIMLLKLAIQVVSVLRFVRSYPSYKSNGYRYVEVDRAVSPFSFFNYIVYNPESHSQAELEMILKHEKVHVRQWHSFDILLANLNRSFQWLNPFAWLYKSSIEENLEYLADHKTISEVDSRKEYQLALIKASSPLVSPSITNPFYQSFIKKRIIMLNKSNSNKNNLWKLGLVLPALAFFLYSFNVTEVVKYNETEPKTEIKAQPVKVKPILNSDISEEAAKEIIEKSLDPVTTTITSEKSTPEKPAVTTTFVEVGNRETSESKTATFIQEVKVLITKNTTNEELEAIKKRMKKDHGLDMSYEVVRNSSGEITNIAISYSGNGTNGNYTVDDDRGIEDFYFYQNEDGETGFWSEAREKRRQERNVEKEIRKKERVARMKEREIEQEERMMDMKKRMKRQEERMMKRQEEMSRRQEEIARRSEEIAKKSYNLAKARSNSWSSAKSKGSNDVYVYSSTGEDGDVIIINKDTTDAELEDIKRDLAAKGITFKYSKVKRNARGELVRIKIVKDDGKGSKSTVLAAADDDDPIVDIIIDN